MQQHYITYKLLNQGDLIKGFCICYAPLASQHILVYPPQPLKMVHTSLIPFYAYYIKIPQF